MVFSSVGENGDSESNIMYGNHLMALGDGLVSYSPRSSIDDGNTVKSASHKRSIFLDTKPERRNSFSIGRSNRIGHGKPLNAGSRMAFVDDDQPEVCMSFF